MGIVKNTKANNAKQGGKNVQKSPAKQTVNPSFNFKWDSGQKSPKAKVFAKKRNPAVPQTQQNSKDKKIVDEPVINVKENIVKPKPNFEKSQNNMVNVQNEKVQNKGPKFNKQNKFNRNDSFKKNNDANNDSLNKSNENINGTSNDVDSLPKGHIKRKQKKDKLLAKRLAKEGKQGDIKLPNNNDQKNYSLFSEKHKKLYVDTRGGKSVSEKVFTGSEFKDLNIHRHLISNLEKINFKEMTNVQAKSIPVVMSGKNTLIRSQTGSGKTLAYAVPIIDALQGLAPRLKRTDGVQAIIVVPTRELALQTHELFSKINTFQWINVGHLCGGENRKSEKDRIKKGINVLIGTPGRLLDHVLHTVALKVDKVRCLVLDEADRLLDMGFRRDIISLVEALDNAKVNSEYDPMALLKQQSKTISEEPETENGPESDENLPTLKNPKSKVRQTILLSATLTKGVSELAEFTMKDHTYIDALDHTSNAIIDSFVIPDTVTQEFILTYVKHRLFTLSALLVAKAKENAKIFVFMASTQMVEYHYELFSKCLVKMPVNRGKFKVGNVALLENDSDDDDDEEEVVLDTPIFKLHGSMDQKMRKEVFTSFKAADKGILICTDVAARGLDIPLADCIVQYTGPQTDEDYLHRVGRTGRAGKSGTAVIFLTHEEQDYISHLKEHRVFLKKRDPQPYLEHLIDLMQENDFEAAATALQKRYESCVAKDKDLYKSACFAYSTWSRFYNSYPSKMRAIFDFKKVNLGHYVTSFALRETPTSVAKLVRGQVGNVEPPRLNRKLANHEDNLEMKKRAPKQKGEKKLKSLSLVTSEFSSGLEPVKKKKKKNLEDD